MATLFTMIIDGDLPGRFVWEDEVCVAFLTIEPLTPGHTLVVPRREFDHWLDAPADLRAHLFEVCHEISGAIDQAYQPEKVGLMIAGLEVPHLHIHLAAINELSDLDFAGVDRDPDATALDEAASRIRQALRDRGAAGVSDRG
ncbi:HIT family protein [Euzebya tangerina]|uniref:HIT family protein n=1 Tax=Euzebya tangerina TaxID=591198 RepID=UPI000E310DE0|nr:HIT family protein [Euzebya tangerina]